MSGTGNPHTEKKPNEDWSAYLCRAITECDRKMFGAVSIKSIDSLGGTKANAIYAQAQCTDGKSAELRMTVEPVESGGSQILLQFKISVVNESGISIRRSQILDSHIEKLKEIAFKLNEIMYFSTGINLVDESWIIKNLDSAKKFEGFMTLVSYKDIKIQYERAALSSRLESSRDEPNGLGL